MTNPAAKRIHLLAFDVDGVLTDGTILLGANGDELKAFNVKDGLGLARATRAGLVVAFISGRRSPSVARRAQELGVPHCIQNCNDKQRALEQLTASLELQRDEVAFVGDDLNDLPAFAASGLRIAVADAAPELKRAADVVTRCKGGHGAAREVVEMILKARRAWNPRTSKEGP